MAVTKEGSRIDKFYGLAADVKPKTTAIGSVFYAMDTGASFVWTGSAWVEDLRFSYSKASS